MILSLESMGYTVFDWNVVTNDSLLYMAPSAKSTYDYIKENFIETFEKCLRENESKDSAPIIILMHETVPETVDLMPWMLEYIISRGYVFGDLAQFGGSWTFADR
jgi:peptidoglycan/xylan/chitin deacetylase (PgdA/CDA1 family)